MTFESWGHTTKQLLFQWNENELTVNPSVTEGLNQHSCEQEFINLTHGTSFSTGTIYMNDHYRNLLLSRLILKHKICDLIQNCRFVYECHFKIKIEKKTSLSSSSNLSPIRIVCDGCMVLNVCSSEPCSRLV